MLAYFVLAFLFAFVVAADDFTCKITGEAASGELCCSPHCSEANCGAPYTGESNAVDPDACGITGEGCCVFEAAERNGGIRDCLDTLQPPCIMPVEDDSPAKVVQCSAPVDLVFAIDVSGSVNFFQYQKLRNWLVRIASNVGVAQEAVRFGVIAFGSKAVEVVPFFDSDVATSLQALPDTESGFSALQDKTGRGTSFVKALQTASIMFDKADPRENQKRSLFVLSDGELHSNELQSSVEKYAKVLRMNDEQFFRSDLMNYQIFNKAVEIFTITVGYRLQPVMEAMASPLSEHHAFVSPSLDDLDKLTDVLTQATCLPVVPPPCEQDVDLVFVLDSSGSVGKENWVLVREFVQDTVNALGLSGSRVGIVKFSTKATTVSGLEADPLKLQLILADENKFKYERGQTHTAYGLESALQVMKQSTNPRKLVVLVSDGGPTCVEGKGDSCETNCEKGTCKVTDLADQIKATATLVTVAVGKAARADSLKNLASSPTHFIDTPNFDSLNSLTSKIIEIDCKAQKSVCGEGVFVDDGHKSASDNGSCSRDAPCKTLSGAKAVVKSGCPIYVTAGTYTGPLNFPHFSGGEYDIRCIGTPLEPCTFDAQQKSERFLVDKGAFLKLYGVHFIGSQWETGVLHVQEACVQLIRSRFEAYRDFTTTLITVNGGSLRAIASIFSRRLNFKKGWNVGIRVMQPRKSVVTLSDVEFRGFTFAVSSDRFSDPFDEGDWVDPAAAVTPSSQPMLISLRNVEFVGCWRGVHLHGTNGRLQVFNVKFNGNGGSVDHAQQKEGIQPLQTQFMYVNADDMDVDVYQTTILLNKIGSEEEPVGIAKFDRVQRKVVNQPVSPFGVHAGFSIQLKSGNVDLKRISVWGGGSKSWSKGAVLGGGATFHVADSVFKYHGYPSLGNAVYFAPSSKDTVVTLRGLQASDFAPVQGSDSTSAYHLESACQAEMRRSLTNTDAKGTMISCIVEADALWSLDDRTLLKLESREFGGNSPATSFASDRTCVTDEVLADDGLRQDTTGADTTKLGMTAVALLMIAQMF